MIFEMLICSITGSGESLPAPYFCGKGAGEIGTGSLCRMLSFSLTYWLYAGRASAAFAAAPKPSVAVLAMMVA